MSRVCRTNHDHSVAQLLRALSSVCSEPHRESKRERTRERDMEREAERQRKRTSEVSAVSWICCAHHVLSIEELLCELRYGECSVGLATTRCEWREADHEEVETREGDEIDS